LAGSPATRGNHTGNDNRTGESDCPKNRFAKLYKGLIFIHYAENAKRNFDKGLQKVTKGYKNYFGDWGIIIEHMEFKK
jgi:hypothetical protein